LAICCLVSPKHLFLEGSSANTLVIKNKKVDQAHLVIGFRSFDQYNKKNYILKLAATILGKGFSSRLFSKMRDELGLCYYTGAGLDTYTDRGAFIVRSGVAVNRIHEAVSVIMEEFKKLRDIKIPEDELQKAKFLFLLVDD
jgi:predicted Zn-dependent peptidase